MAPGYYRFPAIHDDTVVFVCEDDLWTVAAGGGVARRLTANPGEVFRPALSPDGALLAYTGREEGHAEVYVMPALGGPARRLTFLGAASQVVGWSPDGAEILFASNAGQPFVRITELYAVAPADGSLRKLPTGPATSISYGPEGAAVIARHVTDLARWKRYRGGLTGDLWVDGEGEGEYRRLVQLQGNLAAPLWLGERIYFVSDHQGVGNIYSVTPSGADLRRHTHHRDYYVRHPASDGRRIVYHAGADLFVFDPASNENRRIEVEFYSPQVQRKRRFVGSERYLRDYDLHPAGHSLAVTVRGKAFTFANWEGAAIQQSEGDGRARMAAWLHDGKRIVSVTDAPGEETLEVRAADGHAPPRLLEGLDIGRPKRLIPSPSATTVALGNHRNELLLVDLETATLRLLDRSRHGRIVSFAWSPDGRWLAYSFADTQQTAIIRLVEIESGAIHDVTRPVLYDSAPAFDPEGNYLYFISYRDFDPVYDSVHFDLNFPRSTRPFLVTLRADLPSPFIPQPPSNGEEKKEEQKPAEDEEAEPAEGKPGEGEQAESEQAQEKKEGQKDEKKEEKKAKPLVIDLEGIADRVVAFPVPIGIYHRIRGIKGKALFTAYPVMGSLHQTHQPSATPAAHGRIEVYDFAERNHETLVEGVTSFDVAQDGKLMVYRAGHRLRVIKAGEKPKDHGPPGRKSGWIDLGRVQIAVDPAAEWHQMYREAWRLQRDHFWTPDMSGVDWQAVYTRYLPLLDRVATRSEFSDLLWEMQGELGTSHAYEMGGDYRREPHYHQGFLGADLRLAESGEGYLVERIVRGDVWDEQCSSPLGRPGIGVRVGDRLLAINGRRLGRALSPQEALVSQAGSEVLLTVQPAAGGEARAVTVRTLRNEAAARYRDWVEGNRARVHAATEGRVGYVHVPDMSARGYAEFHRGYLAEVARAGLIVDVRFNGGGHVSQLLLEKLSRRRLGYDVSRWGEPTPYPLESVLGPMVALTNEHAGSDGDIFSHTFKLLGLGPLIGKRTWGGVIGINPSDVLVDGGVTTQPEFSFWFNDVGWAVENYGTEPTIEVEFRPQDYVAGHDPQLERAISEVLRLMAEEPPQVPDFGQRPQLQLPTLPEEGLRQQGVL